MFVQTAVARSHATGPVRRTSRTPAVCLTPTETP